MKDHKSMVAAERIMAKMCVEANAAGDTRSADLAALAGAVLCWVLGDPYDAAGFDDMLATAQSEFKGAN